MLVVHRSNRAERLVARLAALVRDDPAASPFDPEVIVVQSRGMETWLSQRLSRELGVWAHAEFPFPRTMIQRLLHAALGDEAGGDRAGGAAFEVEALTWSVMALLPGMLREPAFADLRSYLADDPRGIKRYQLARRIAATVDQYVVYRPEMVLGWQRGQDRHWQAELFRALVRRHGDGHMASAARRALDAMAAPARPDLLPRRVSLFGLSTLPPLYLRLLAALPDDVPVHLFTLSPSPRAWSALRRRREAIRALRDERSAPDEMARALDLPPGNPLLESLGGLGRDFQLLLEGETAYRDAGDDLYVPPPAVEEGSLLAAIQADVFHDRPPRPGTKADALARDASISLHACHSPRREIEVLHAQLLALFDADEDLQPHDVIVMLPDVEAYAPLIDAVFGTRTPAIPYRISDRSVRREAPVIEAFGALLALVRSRLEAPAVLDLLAMEPVRDRFGLDGAAVDRIRGWVRGSGARWGMDAAHRRDQGMPPLDDHTWRFGLDRMLLGYAQPEPRLFAGLVPLDTAEGADASILGGLASFADTLFTRLRALEAPRPAAAWRDQLLQLLELMVRCGPDDEYQHQLIRGALAELAEAAAAAGVGDDLDLDVVRAWLFRHFDLASSAHGFLSGGVTFCNLLPMRSIPFPVVCLAGMQDGAFPRSTRAPGFDLTSSDPRPGDRSGRADDRQLFLEALLSARRALIVTYVGRGIRDNADLPPSVVVSELLDVIDRSLDGGGGAGRDARDLLVVRHPMQPFSPAYFRGAERLFSYDRGDLAGAVALESTRPPPAPFMSAALAPRDDGDGVPRVSLHHLARFWRSPGEDLLGRILGIDLAAEDTDLEPREPVSLGGIEAFEARAALLAHLLQGGRPADAWPLLRGRGDLPHGTAGRCLAESLTGQIAPVAQAALAQRALGAALDPLDLELDLGDAVLHGRVGDLFRGFRLVVTAGQLHPRRRIEAWILHLALCAASGTAHPCKTVLIGRDAAGAATLEFGPVADAADHLARLVRWFLVGQRWPLPFFAAASRAYASRVRDGAGDDDTEAVKADALAAARQQLRGSRFSEGEAGGAGLERLWSGLDPLADDPGPPRAPAGGEPAVEVPGFRTLALGVWEPVLDAEETRP